ncbi:MAG TPA: hypothetical protein VIG08_14310 [Gemmatimonadales bacterium]|jgi:hypothetical protein
MSETAAMSSRPRHTCRSPATFVAASVVLLSVAAPGPRRPGGPAQPDTLPAFKNPTGIAVGKDGAVFISSQGDSSVVVYAPGAKGLARPVRRIGPQSGLVSPQAVALDSRGGIVVSSLQHRAQGNGSIIVYRPGATGDAVPERVIAGSRTGLSEPSALALGPRGRLYVRNGPRGNVLSVNGLLRDVGSTVLAFNPLASGDVQPEQTLLDIIDTIVQAPPPSRPPTPARTVDTLCGQPPPTSGSRICQVVDHVEPREPRPFPGPAQRPDTIRPQDVAAGAGRLLVLTARGVTSYNQAIVRISRPYARVSPDSIPRLRGTRVALGPGGEFFVARSTASQMEDIMASMTRKFSQNPLSAENVRIGPNLLERVPAKKPDNKPAETPPAKTDTAAQTFKKVESILESMIGHAFISVYRLNEQGDTTLLRTIEGPNADLRAIADLAVGGDGSLYVLGNTQKGGLRIAVFAPNAAGDVAPIRAIEGPATGLKGAVSLTLDRQGRIYVANNRSEEEPVFGRGTVTVYASDAAGDAPPIRTIEGWSTHLSKPSGIAVADDGTIYVANLDVYNDDRGSLQTFAARASEGDQAERTLTGRATGFAGPQGIAIGRADTLYVLSRQLTRITVYPPEAGGSAPPVRTIEGPTTGLPGGSRFFSLDPGLPRQLAIDAQGYLYVADPVQASGLNAYGPDLGAIRIYRPGTTGEAPVRVITGGFTKLNGPGGLAVDRQGRLYVPNRYGTGPGSVTVYDAKADGDVHPLRTLAGPATDLQAPAAVALDAHDTLYVVNASSVTVYAPNARGDASPIRTIVAR